MKRVPLARRGQAVRGLAIGLALDQPQLRERVTKQSRMEGIGFARRLVGLAGGKDTHLLVTGKLAKPRRGG
jgi:hypothetical protein